MHSGTILKISIVVIGLLLMALTLLSLSKRKMEESFSLAWVLGSLGIILAGFLTSPSRWAEFVSLQGLILIIFVAVCLIYAAFYVSLRVSELIRRTNELAMQVALLKQEDQELRASLEGETVNTVSDEKNSK